MTEASVSFAGNLTDDPEVRSTEAGIARAMFRCTVRPAGAGGVVLRSGRARRPEPSTPRSPSRRAARLATPGRHQPPAARTAGYQIITQIPDMGSHFLNPAIQGFDVRKPLILVHACHGRAWQLVALE